MLSVEARAAQEPPSEELGAPLCHLASVSFTFLCMLAFFFFSGKVLFFMIYLLSFQSLFSVSSGYFIYHSGPLGGQSVLRHSYF